MARASHRAAIIYGRAHSLTLVQTHAPLSVMLRRIAPHLTVRQPITLLAKTLDGRRLNCFTSGPKKGAAHFCSAITAAPDHRINVDHQTQSRVGVRPYGRARAIEAALTSPPCPLVKRAWVLLGAQISQLHGWSPQRYRPSSPHQPRLQRPTGSALDRLCYATVNRLRVCPFRPSSSDHDASAPFPTDGHANPPWYCGPKSHLAGDQHGLDSCS
jgi:hypothetical protein